MSDTREEQRAAARFEAECASGNTISRALHRRELAEKDAAITALADALLAEAWRRAGSDTYDAPPCWCIHRADTSLKPHTKHCDNATSALRLAGRLP